MAYRSDEEARKAHVEALEKRIAELEAQNAELLMGERPAETLFGVSLTVSASDERKGRVRKKALRQFLEKAELVVGQPGTHVSGDDVAVWRSDSRDLDVTVRIADGATTVRVAERIGLVTGAMVGGVLGGAGGVSVLALLLWLRTGDGGPVFLIGIPIWMLLMYGLARFVLARHVRSRQQKVGAYAIELINRLPAMVDDETEEERPSERS